KTVFVALTLLAAPLAGQQIPQVVIPTGQTAAQAAAAQRLGRSVTNEEIANAIQRSGLSQQQLRGRLQQAGLDPSMLDPFLGGPTTFPGAAPDAADESFSLALEQLGLMAGDQGTQPGGPDLGGAAGTGANQPVITADLYLPPGRLAREVALEVFGKSLFVA